MFCIKIYDLSNNDKGSLTLGDYTPKQTTLLMKQTEQSSFEGEQQNKTLNQMQNGFILLLQKNTWWFKLLQS